MIKIGITGGRGFISSHIAEVLNQKKNAKVYYFDLPQGNLLEPGRRLEDFVKDKKVIIHAAAVNRGTDLEIISGSIVVTWNIISAIKKTKSKAKVIFLSSTQAGTDTLYGQSKRITEIMIEDFSGLNKTPVFIFRLANVFGEGCRPFYNSVVATFCHQTANGQKLTIHKKNKKINLVYVKDAAKLIAEEVFKKRKRNFYLKRVVSKNEMTVSEIAGMIRSLAGGRKPNSKFEKDLHKTYISYLKNG